MSRLGQSRCRVGVEYVERKLLGNLPLVLSGTQRFALSVKGRAVSDPYYVGRKWVVAVY
jgi:hypothetical protein